MNNKEILLGIYKKNPSLLKKETINKLNRESYIDMIKELNFIGYRVSELPNNEKSLSGIRYIKKRLEIHDNAILSLAYTLQSMKIEALGIK